MQENPTGSNLPVYASLSTMRQEPSQSEMNNGVIPLDTLPAAWWNWMWNAITQAQNDSMYNDDVLFTEINNVLAAAGITPGTSVQHDQLRQAIMVIKSTIATTASAGSVLSTDSGTTGTIKVATDGKMTVNNFGDIASFHGATKDNLVGALNEAYDIAYGNKDNAGELTALTTTEKSTLVGAINELDAGKAPVAHASTATTYGVGNADNYGHVKLTDTPSSDSATSGVAATPKLVQDMVRGGMGAVNASMFTYVVDSDQKLADWANNVTDDGQDYTSVLIRKGTWSHDSGVNLTAAGTKSVVGEPGSKLSFNLTDSSTHINIAYTDYAPGLYYITQDWGVSGNFMYNVHVDVIPPENDDYYHMYYNTCAFAYCSNLTLCSGRSLSSSGGGENYLGAHSVGFEACTNMHSCFGLGQTSYSPVLYNTYDTGSGYHNCTYLYNCMGVGKIDAENQNSGYGFNSCCGMLGCRAGDTSSTDVFYQCSASNKYNPAYLCSDNPEGGWNDPHNVIGNDY